MPFKKNDAQTIRWAKMGARKPHMVEKEQREKMERVLTRDLELVEKVQKGKMKPEDREKLTLLKERVLKILDKLHASKSETELRGEITELQKIELDQKTNDLLKEFIVWRKKKI